MIQPISVKNNSIHFSANDHKDGILSKKLNESKNNELMEAHDELLKSNLSNRVKRSFHKFSSASTIYAASGLKGDRNANFYEFLSLGTIPYLVGSGTLMAVFNAASKHFDQTSTFHANKRGQKFALGVLFYALAKEVSKSLINAPVKWATGVDHNQPYQKVVYTLPKHVDDTDIRKTEQHKVWESVDFPYYNIMYKDEQKGENRLEYFDKVARKLNLGKNNTASDIEVKPRIKEIVSGVTAAKNVTSALWAATGVCLAMQDNWTGYFENVLSGNKLKKGFSKEILSKNAGILWSRTKDFGESFVDACKNLWHGAPHSNKFAKIGGKALITTALGLTLLSNLVIIARAKRSPEAKDIINDRKEGIVL